MGRCSEHFGILHSPAWNRMLWRTKISSEWISVFEVRSCLVCVISRLASGNCRAVTVVSVVWGTWCKKSKLGTSYVPCLKKRFVVGLLVTIFSQHCCSLP